jgi:hypothetical protein
MMPVRETRPVDDVPRRELQRWRIFLTNAGTRHFVGCSPGAWTGRVSSAIEQFDVVGRRGLTRSGRVYQLVGPSAFHPDADYVWQQWCSVNKVVSYDDITFDVIPEADDDNAR